MSGDAGPAVGARPLQLGVLFLGILAVSTAAIFIRYAQPGAPSLTIAAGRMALAALALAPLALARHRATLARLTARQLGLALLAGAFLAGHFAFWITSLEHTSVVSSVVLVCSTPLWVGLLAPLVLRERLTRAVALGILVAFAGGVVVGLGDAGGGALAKPGGRALVQTITIDESLFDRYRRGTDFIQQYVFPGGMLPSPSEFRRQAARAGLRVAGAHSFGSHYARTLASWRTRFLARLAAVRAQGFDERFLRIWHFYLAYCEAAFAEGNTDVTQYTLEKA